MFIGHFAVALGTKRVAPDVSLGTAIVAASFLDLVWPVLVAFGVEVVKIDPGNMLMCPFDFVSYPYSHSLLMSIVWGVLFGGIYRWCGGSKRGSLWLALGVISHWFLDLVVHRPDLALVPGVELRLGFGLWNSLVGTLTVEGALFTAGVWLYATSTRARDGVGRWGFWGLLALLLVTYLASCFGPPPPNVMAVVIADIVGTALTVVLAVWIDRHRSSVATNQQR